MATDIVIPSVGESVTSGVVAAWRKKDGEFVQRDEVVMDLETDKITMEVTAPASGVLRTSAKEGDQVPIGAVVGRVEESAAAPVASKRPPDPEPRPVAADPLKTLPSSESGREPADGNIRATPLARKVAQDMGVDLSKIEGTGAGNRIREQDVVAYAQAMKSGKAPAAPPVKPVAPVSASSVPRTGRGVTRERMSPLRQRVAMRLVEAQHTAAMLTTFNECDMTAVMALRARHKEAFEKRYGVGLGFMSFFVKAAVNALRAFSVVNASIVQDESGAAVVEKHDYCDIAIAVASPKGLVVPVIRDCQNLSMAGIEAAVKDLGTRARDGKLTLEEMQGGTFTITNGGVFGSLLSTPILNPPQSAILGMHAIKNRAVEDPDHPGQAVIRPMMYLALSYDHRLVDGAEAVRFLVRVKECIEAPERLLLEL
jgi:2-oxoglutarate dehydrogenase E2 component (dihydrolipoamide succinyltransferase)